MIEVTDSEGEKMPKGNPKPVQTEEFKRQQFKAFGDIPGDYPLGDKVWGIRLPVDVEQRLKAMDNKKRVAWMRKTLTEAARAELIK